MVTKLLVIDDDHAACRLIKAIFETEGVEVAMAHDGRSGIDRVVEWSPDIVLLDFHLPELDGLQVLERLKTTAPALPVIMLTASTEVKTAVRATQLGAFDYLTKPIDTDEVVLVVRRALETRALRLEVADLRRRVASDDADKLALQMGESSHVKQIVEQVRTVAASNFTVLILGETGTGKELVARALHQQSDRRRQPFIALDCGAIPELLLESELFGHEKGAFTGAERRKAGRLQLAEGGTCFMDEMGNLPLGLQAKLLRVLESKEVQPVGADRATAVDIRFVAATNNDLQARVAEGAFRADLFFRLAQYTISLPPLRQRPEDICYLAQRFIEEASVELRRPVRALLPAGLDALRQHEWPGNVRELRNVVRHAVLQSTEVVIRPEVIQSILQGDTQPAATASVGLNGRSLKEIAEHAALSAERHAIAQALKTTEGNKTQAARALKTDYKTLHIKMKRLGMRSHDFTS